MNSLSRSWCRAIAALVVAFVLVTLPTAARADVGTTALLKDIRAGATGSNPTDFHSVADDRVVFSATDTTGTTLFVTDGTEGGTDVLLTSTDVRVASPAKFVRFDADRVFFYADFKLFVTDGTKAGTLDLGALPSTMEQLPVVFNGHLYFPSSRETPSIGTELYRTDGTPEGTELVKDLWPVGTSAGIAAQHVQFAVADDGVYFTARTTGYGHQVWKTDGTTDGTVRLTGLGHATDDPVGTARPSDTAGDRITHLTVAGDQVFFIHRSAAYGRELWVLDDAVPGLGARLVKDIWPVNNDGTSIVYPIVELTAVGDKVFFGGNDSATASPANWQAWVSDGTEAGTVKLNNACTTVNCPTSGTPPSPTHRFGFIEYDGLVYFRTDARLFRTDGTPAGTTANIGTPSWGNSGSSRPEHFFVHDGLLYFSTFHSDQGTPAGCSINCPQNEPVVTDGVGAVTMLANIIPPGVLDPPQHRGPLHWFTFDDDVYFAHGNTRKLYRTDATPGGTAIVSSSVSLREPVAGGWNNAKADLYAGDFAAAGDVLVFRGRTAETGEEVFVHDPDAVLPQMDAPTFGAVTRTADGFTVPISNFDAGATYLFAPGAGVVSRDDDVITVTGLAPNESREVVVTVDKAGYTSNFAVVEGQALAAPVLEVEWPDEIVVGQAAEVLVTVSGAHGTPSGTVELIRGTGETAQSIDSSTLDGGGTATLDISVEDAVEGSTAWRVTYSGDAVYDGAFEDTTIPMGGGEVGLPLLPVPTFGAVTRTADGFTASITNFDVDAGYLFAPSDGVSLDAGVVTVAGLAPNESREVLVTVTKLGHTSNVTTIEGQALPTPDPDPDPDPDPVGPVAPALMVGWPAQIVAGTAYSVTVTVSGASGTPTGTVTLYRGEAAGAVVSAADLAGGKAALTIPDSTLVDGSSTWRVTYAGDSAYLAAEASATIQVQAKVRPAPTLDPVVPKGPVRGAGLPVQFTAPAQDADYLSFDFTNDGVFDATVPVAKYPHTAVFHGTPGERTVAVQALQQVEGQEDHVASQVQRTTIRRDRNRRFEEEQTGNPLWGSFSMSVEDDSVLDLLMERMERPDWGTFERQHRDLGPLCGDMLVTFEHIGQVEGYMCIMSAAEAANKYQNPDMLWAAIAGVQTVFVVDEIAQAPVYPETLPTGRGTLRVNGMTLANQSLKPGKLNNSQIFVIPSVQRIIAADGSLMARVDDLVHRPNDNTVSLPVVFKDHTYIDLRLGRDENRPMPPAGYSHTLVTQDVKNGWGPLTRPHHNSSHRTLLGMPTRQGDTVTTKLRRQGSGAQDRRFVEFEITKNLPAPLNTTTSTTTEVSPSGRASNLDDSPLVVPYFTIGPFVLKNARFTYKPEGLPGVCASGYLQGTGTIELIGTNVALEPPPLRGIGLCNGELVRAGAEVVFGIPPQVAPGVTLDKIGFNVQTSPYFLLAGTAGFSVAQLVGIEGAFLFANPDPRHPMPFAPETVPSQFSSMWRDVPGGDNAWALRYACYNTLTLVSNANLSQSDINNAVDLCRALGMVVATGPTFGVAGAVTFKPLDIDLASGHVVYIHPGYVDIGGSLDYRIAVLTLAGRARIQANTQNGRYNAEALLRACLDFGIAEACVKLQAIVSSKGVAGCGEVLLIAVWFGYTWGDSLPELGFGCSIGGYRVNVQGPAGRSLARSKAKAAGGDDSFTVTAGERLVNVTLDGAGGAPSFTLTTPDGRSIRTKSNEIFQAGNVSMMHWPKAGRTIVGVKAGTPGTYTIKLDADSPAIAKVTKAVGTDATVSAKKVTKQTKLVATKVRTKVNGKVKVVTRTKQVATGKQIASWDASKLGAGLTYELWEQSETIARHLGAVKPKGTKVFVPEATATGEKRKLVLKVKRDGLVTGEVVLGRFQQAAQPAPKAPVKVTASHAGTRVIASWTPVVGARSYTVEARTKSGQRWTRELPAKTRKVVMTGVPVWEPGTVKVRAKNALAQVGAPGESPFKASGVKVNNFGTKKQAQDDAKTRLANLARKSSVKVATSVKTGTQATVTGASFKPGEKVKITLAGGTGTGTNKFTVTLKANAQGELVWKVTLKNASTGAWKITATGVTSKRTATAKLTVKR